METEPLVTSKSRAMNYNSEDGIGSCGGSEGHIGTRRDSNLDPNSGGDTGGGGGGTMNSSPPRTIHGITGKSADGEGKPGPTILERFHEDALLQVGHGKMQVILFLVVGLVIATDLSDLMALIMSSKSAQFEFCVGEAQKSWIVGATLLGMGVGSIFWGSLSDRVGRRRALMYALALGSIFTLASVIMPTEGTFLTARILSGIGLGGTIPVAVTYFSEFVQEKKRRHAVSLLFLFWPLGAAYVILMCWLSLPTTGFHLSEELKQHFSAWRRLLSASAVPSLLSIVALIFMPEAPLNLMQNGRDADALSVYKRIHRMNYRGKNSAFCFSEIEIPTVGSGPPTVPNSVIGDLKKAFDSFWRSFLLIWSGNRKRLTIAFTLIWFMAAIGQGALSSWVISRQAILRDWTLDKDTLLLDNVMFTHVNMTKDFVNIRYRFCTFESVSIFNVMMNHVKFENCSFNRVTFQNVRASYVIFKYSNLTECDFVDTDLGLSNFPNSNLENITYSGLDPDCHLFPDFSMELANDMIDSGLPVLGIFLGIAVSSQLLHFVSRSRLVSAYLIISALISISLTIWTLDQVWALVGHSIINFVLAGMWGVLVTTFDKYPTWTRGAALGLFCAGGRLGSFFGVGLFGTTLRGILVPIFSSIFLVLSACVAFRSHF